MVAANLVDTPRYRHQAFR